MERSKRKGDKGAGRKEPRKRQNPGEARDCRSRGSPEDEETREVRAGVITVVCKVTRCAADQTSGQLESPARDYRSARAHLLNAYADRKALREHPPPSS